MTTPAPDWADEISRQIFSTPVPDDLPVTDMRRWTEDHFAAALRKARQDALEEAAKIAKIGWLEAEYADVADADIVCRLCEDIFDAIRQLKDKQQ